MEIWKQIKNYEGLYEISTNGQVRNYKTKFILNTKPRPDGYIRIGLWKNKKQTYHYLARLIFENFKSIPDGSFEINHIDKNKLNNFLANLELISQRENCCHRSKDKINKTSKHPGVCKAYDGKFRSYIYIDGKQKSLGYYFTEDQAYQARVNFEKENGIVNKYI